MNENSTTPDEDNLDTAPQGTENETVENNDNLDASKSTDTDSAGDDNKDTTTDDDKSGDTPATQLDEDLDDWIAKRGLKVPETDEEKQALQELRNEQRAYTRTQQQKKEAEQAQDLNKGIDDLKKEVEPEKSDEDEEEDEFEARLKAVEADRDQEITTRLQSEFYTENRVSEAEHQEILKAIQEKVARKGTPEGKLAALDYWGSPEALPDLLDIAKARLSKGDSEAAAEAAAKAERERIAKESHSNSTSRNAKTTTTGDKSPEQERLERFKDPNW